MAMTKRQREYMTLLQDPRWQRKRLEVLNLDRWACSGCFKTNINLQVHHGYYEADMAPWEYPVDALFTLCDVCHERAEKAKKEVVKSAGRIHPRYHWQVIELLREVRERFDEAERARGGAVDNRLTWEFRTQALEAVPPSVPREPAVSSSMVRTLPSRSDRFGKRRVG